MRFKPGLVKGIVANARPGPLAIADLAPGADDLGGPRAESRRASSRREPPVTVAGTRAGLAMAPEIGREVACVLAALAPTLASGVCAAVHVTAPGPGNGVSTVARTLAAIAGYLPGCRPLLLSMQVSAPNPDPAGVGLPDIIAEYRSHGVVKVVDITAGRQAFHAASLITGYGGQAPSDASARPIAGLWSALQHAYDLIILDCPPVPALTGFLPIAHGPPQVLLVVSLGATRAAEAVRSRVLVERMGGQLLGAVMNQRKPGR